MSDSLAIYLRDHLAAARTAIDLLGTTREQHEGEPLGDFATMILAEVEQDRQLLREIVERAEGDGPSKVKEAIGWLSEKAARAKLRHEGDGDLTTLQTLETLALGVLGKLALWRALDAIAGQDPRLAGIDFKALAARAEDQHARLEERRLKAASTALGAR